MSTPALPLDGIAVRNDGRRVVHPLALAVPPGRRVALVGPAGTGKTSLLRVVAGLDAPDAGTIRIAGRDATDAPPEARRAVYLHQEPVLFGLRTVRDEVAFPAIVRGVARTAAHRLAEQALGRVRAEGLAGRDPRTLSGGERQRVVLARALAADPAVLLLDEPFGALDPSLRAQVREAVLGALDGVRAAVLLVTHDVDEAAAVGDRMGVMLDGRLVQCDAPAALLAHPASVSVARLLGHPTRLAAHVDDAGTAHTPFVRLACALPPGRACVVARPDAGVARSDPAGDAVVRTVLARSGGTLLRVERDGADATVLVAGPIPAPGARVRIDWDTSRLHVLRVEEGDDVG